MIQNGRVSCPLTKSAVSSCGTRQGISALREVDTVGATAGCTPPPPPRSALGEVGAAAASRFLLRGMANDEQTNTGVGAVRALLVSRRHIMAAAAASSCSTRLHAYSRGGGGWQQGSRQPLIQRHGHPAGVNKIRLTLLKLKITPQKVPQYAVPLRFAAPPPLSSSNYSPRRRRRSPGIHKQEQPEPGPPILLKKTLGALLFCCPRHNEFSRFRRLRGLERSKAAWCAAARSPTRSARLCNFEPQLSCATWRSAATSWLIQWLPLTASPTIATPSSCG